MKDERSGASASDLIDLGAAREETRAMTFGADDSKAGLWLMPGLTLD
jgi:hypothetical protein